MLLLETVVRRFRRDIEGTLTELQGVIWRWGSEPRLAPSRASGRGLLFVDVVVEHGLPDFVGAVLRLLPDVLSLELRSNTITLAFDPMSAAPPGRRS